MTVQTLELAGQRFVVVPEKEFRKLEQEAKSARPTPGKRDAGQRFASVTRLKVSGIPASQLLIQDRR